MLLVQFFIQPWYTLKKAAIPAVRYFREALAQPLAASLVFLAICWLARGWTTSARLASVVLTVGWQCLLAAGISLVIGINAAERRRLLQSVRQLYGQRNEDAAVAL